MVSRALQFQPKIPCHALLASGGVRQRIWKSDKFVQWMYLEVIDYQLFAVNTVEKWIGYYLCGYGK